jgi:hypothetical protein
MQGHFLMRKHLQEWQFSVSIRAKKSGQASEPHLSSNQILLSKRIICTETRCIIPAQITISMFPVDTVAEERHVSLDDEIQINHSRDLI